MSRELQCHRWLPMTLSSHHNLMRHICESRTTHTSHELHCPQRLSIRGAFSNDSIAQPSRVTNYVNTTRTIYMRHKLATLYVIGAFWTYKSPSLQSMYASHEVGKCDFDDEYASQTRHLIRHTGVFEVKCFFFSKYVCESQYMSNNEHDNLSLTHTWHSIGAFLK